MTLHEPASLALGLPPARIADPASELDAIIYRISHDLRASVRALQELPRWIAEDLAAEGVVLPAGPSRHLNLAGSHADRLDAMLNGLLEYSRVGRMQVLAPLRPQDALASVLEDMALPAEVAVAEAVDPGRVRMGEDDLHRIFAIPISNAVRFHPRRAPRLEVAAGPLAGGLWEFRVTDDGPGIPEDKREFVTRPMTKLVSRDEDAGAGMGLAVLRKIAQHYGGALEILTPPSGLGTTVRLTARVG